MNLDRMTICIVGPTACHKTELSLRLARAFNCEIVSADSVAIYRGLDIGSAKPCREERETVPHHMIDCIDCTDASFSVAVFQKMAREAIGDVFARKRTPLIVGGSGLYVDAIYSDFDFAFPSDSLVRRKLELEYEANPNSAYATLQRIDKKTAERLNPNDKKRIVRALEVFYCCGKTMSELTDSFKNKQAVKLYPSIRVGLEMDRAELYRRIDDRVEAMLKRGLLDEARSLYDSISDRELPAMRAIGYAQLFRYFDGEYDLECAVELLKRDTRRFAKRQLTWFKRDKTTKWFKIDDFDSLDEVEAAICNYIRGEGGDCNGTCDEDN
ncbi:MAG: tRNA (adenosine(37)-N6)-dimethylallyltransferase MiaA [Clostridia bacterium]|nr:tRNA (adenosine(37)-N6)-dimethylallyltransferase MiaA [Clostridia bacterium]